MDALSNYYIEHYTKDAVRVLERYSVDEIISCLEHCSDSVVINVLVMLERSLAQLCLLSVPAQTAVKWLSVMPLTDAATLLRGMDAESKQTIIEQLDPVIQRSLTHLLRFDPNTLGAHISMDAPTLMDDITIREAKQRLDSNRLKGWPVIYLLNREGRLTGMIESHVLFTADDDAQLASVKDALSIILHSRTHLIDAIQHPAWHEHKVLPIVDAKQQYLGALTWRDLEQAATQFGGSAPKNIHLLAVLLSLAELFWLGAARMLNPLAGEEHRKS